MKWLPNHAGGTSVAKAARFGLKRHLKEVRRRLKTAGKRTPEDVEDVHQLRVASRRAGAALRVFDELLPRKQSRWWRKRLRRIRGAAGTARDLDVFIERIKAESDHPLHDAILKRLRQQRAAAQKPLAKVAARLGSKKLKRRTRQLLQTLRRPSRRNGTPFADWAPPQLQQHVTEFLAAYPEETFTDAQVHRFRIAGKRLRYAIELLAPAFPSPLRSEIYPQLVAVQERLGGLNDHVAWRGWLGAWQSEVRGLPHKAPLDRQLGLFIAQEDAEYRAARHAWFGEWRTAGPALREKLERLDYSRSA